MLHRVNTSWDF